MQGNREERVLEFKNRRLRKMGSLYEDAVVITLGEKPGDPTVITVNCPDKTGLACDLCRIIFLFGLSISKGDISTDGKWCYIVLWVSGKSSTRWDLLEKRLLEVCPSQLLVSGFDYFQLDNQQPNQSNVFLLKFWCSYNRKDLLHVVTKVFCELELTIRRVKVSTAPDSRVMDLFFITDARGQLHTSERQAETIHFLETVLGNALVSCDIGLAGPEVTACLQSSYVLPPAITNDLFGTQPGFIASSSVSVAMDNTLSPSHTLIQISCKDHKGLIYDITRAITGYNMKICYGRFFADSKLGNSELDLFITQADGKKMRDPDKQYAICSRLRMALLYPLRVSVADRGPDIELLVANPVELSGRGRPLVFHDITLALKILDIQIFLVEIGRHLIYDHEWEVYRILLDEGDALPVSRSYIEEGVRKVLMGWECS